jgi:hypothetical protein
MCNPVNKNNSKINSKLGREERKEKRRLYYWMVI